MELHTSVETVVLEEDLPDVTTAIAAAVEPEGTAVDKGEHGAVNIVVAVEAPTIVTPMGPPPETTTLVMEWLLLKSSNVVLYG